MLVEASWAEVESCSEFPLCETKNSLPVRNHNEVYTAA